MTDKVETETAKEAVSKEKETAVIKSDEKQPEVIDTAVKKKNEKPEISKLAVENDEFCVYIGPSIRGIIQSGMIFSGNKEKAAAFLASEIDKYPLIADLIVPGATISEDRVKVKTPGNLLYFKYKELAAGKKK